MRGYQPGSCAEYVAANATQSAIKPSEIPHIEAAAIVTSGLAALHALRDVAKLRESQSVLINGASGGIGSFAIQIAKSMGAEVTGVCSGANGSLVRSLGADHVITVLLATKDAETGFAEAAEALPQTMMHAPCFITSLVISGLPLTVIAIVAGYFIAKHHKQSIALRLGLHRPSLPWSAWALLLLGSVFVFHIAVGLVWLIEQVIPGDGALLLLYEDISTPWAFVLIAVVGVVPGISEELFFRGFVQRRLLRRFSPAIAIGITTILFALLHVTPHGIALASVMGVWLGVIAWRTGSIWPSVLCHAFVNPATSVAETGRWVRFVAT